MPKVRLPAIEFNNLAGGLDRFNSETIIANNKLTDAENIRHDGPGRLRRRNGMKRFGTDEVQVTQLTPASPDLTSLFARFVIPFIQRSDIAATQFNPVLNLRQQLLFGFDTAARQKVLLVDEGSRFTSPEAFLSYNTNPGNPFFSDKREQAGFTFFDNRIYAGTDFGLKLNSAIAGITLDGEDYEFGYLVRASADISGSVSVNDDIEGATTGAKGKLGRVATTGLFLYNWNGIDFSVSEAIKINGSSAGGFTVAGKGEMQLPGVIMEFVSGGNWLARRWGIRRPTETTLAVDSSGAGAIEANRGISVTASSVSATDPFTVSLSGSPDLSTVQVGDIFKDSAGNDYRVKDFDDTADTLTVSDEFGDGVPATGVGSVFAPYIVRYTFLRHTGTIASSAADNPKLTGGTLISESAPIELKNALFVDISAAGDKIFVYSGWEVTDDPQVTHVRFYRNDSFGTSITDLKHVADVAILGASVKDNFSQIQIQFEPVLVDTNNLQVFGEQGENCGHAIEVVNRRVYVGGNKNNSQRLYASAPRSEHKFSEYFFTSLDITDAPGESIIALKWWARRLYVFMERSVYEVREASTSEIGLDSYRQVSRELGCVTRNGVIDMGDFMFVMTEKGLLAFNGTNFSPKAVTLGVENILGKDLLDAEITKTDTHIFILSTNSRSLNVIITIKHSDGTFALGLDKIDKTVKLPDSFSFGPSLNNFDNTTNDSDFLLCAFPRADTTPDPDVLTYNLVKYDLKGENFDHLLFTGAAADDLRIAPKFSPKVIDFGAFNEARLESLIAFIIQSGVDQADQKAPTGRWLVQFLLNRAADGTAIAFHSAILRPTLDRTIDTVVDTPREPLQHKYTKPFEASTPVSKQTGGTHSGSGLASASGFASVQEILFSTDLNQDSLGRLWKIIFIYEGIRNFEFTSFAMRFVSESER